MVSGIPIGRRGERNLSDMQPESYHGKKDAYKHAIFIAQKMQFTYNRGEFFTKTDLKTGEGFTIAFGWNKGLVSPPSAWKRFLRAIDIGENWVFIFPLFPLIFMINLWYRKGRDPRTREAITVMYEPPRYNNIPLSPAEVGTLVDEKMDTRDITASIVGLAVKGYLRIEEMKREGEGNACKDQGRGIGIHGDHRFQGIPQSC
jgi:hypothetical protein